MHSRHAHGFKLFLCLLPLFVWSAALAEVVSPADDYVVQVWDTDSGLPHSTVTGVAQTADGYIWIGTLRGGLARFDGSRFVNYHPGNTPELSSIEIHKLLVDDGGTLWIGGIDGSLASYRDGKFNCEFETVETPANWNNRWLNGIASSAHNSVILSSESGWLFSRAHLGGTNQWETFPTPNFGGDFCAGPDGAIWYRTSAGHLAKIAGKEVIWLDHPKGLRSPNINRLLKDDLGRLWVGTDKEIAVWDGNAFVDMTPTNGEPEIAVRDLVAGHDGAMWVRTDDRLRKCINRGWLREAEPWNGQFAPSIRPLRMSADRGGGVWVIHYGQGLWHIDSEGQVSRIGEQQGLPDGYVESWCEDREGNFWAGLRDRGLACIRPRVFHSVWPAAAGWENKTMRSICEDADGAMWFGVAGPTVLRWFNNEFTGFTPPPERNAGTETAVLPDGPGRLWVGTALNGLWLLKNGVFKRPFPMDDIGTVVRCLCRDHTGALWIGNEFGLFRWDKGRLTSFPPTNGYSAACCVLAIAEDPAGDIWIGTQAGELRRWLLGKFESFSPSDSSAGVAMAAAAAPNANSGREWFWTLHFDDDGVLWIGTLGGGLLRFKDAHFTRFTTRDGLPNEHVSQILEDDRGQLWLGTRAGISRVKKSELTHFANGGHEPVNFITYGRSDGLPTIECSGGIQPACWKSRDGRLWFSTAKGPVWVNPAGLPFNPLPPPVQLEEILMDGTRIADDPGSSGRSGAPLRPLRIPPGRHFFEFKFTALSFTSPDKVKFQWRLKGWDPDWVEGGNRRTASYSFLQAGNYRFEVRACNNDGVWNQAGASVALTVLPYFWQTWWLKAGVMGLGLSMMLGVGLTVQRRRYRRRIQVLERKHELERERTRIARDIHDQIGANLTKIGMQTSMLERETNEMAASRPLVRGVAESTREMVRTMDEIVWAINPRNDTLENSINYLIQYARGFLRPANIDYQLEVPVDLPDVPLTAEIRHSLFMAFKEALNNAVKHGHPRHLVITLALGERQMKLSVEDDGCGFALEPNRADADGLENMRQRLAAVGGHCEITSAPGQGAKIVFELPLPVAR